MSNIPAECIECECKGTFIRSLETQFFTYGIGPDAVRLSAEVWVSACSSCAFSFTDGDAEEVRDAAVRQHLESLK